MTIEASGTVLNCGWGRLVFANRFSHSEAIAKALLSEEPGKRDIAFYLTDPHVVLQYSPLELFLDPSHTFRIEFDNYKPSGRVPDGFVVEPLATREDLESINRIYKVNRMVPLDVEYVLAAKDDPRLHYAVARRQSDGSVIGAAMGVNHSVCFDDPDKGSSLWALAVDPQAQSPGIGQTLSRYLIEYFMAQGCRQLDLSVMHDNDNAIALYKKLGFERIPVFALKRRNSINEKLFIGEPPDASFNPYAKIIIHEAMRRGIAVEPVDPPRGFFRLSLGGRSVTCRESLSELTSAIALTRCDDKELTQSILREAELVTPPQMLAGTAEENAAFLHEHVHVVVKPARGEQGQGVAVDLTTEEAVETAVSVAREICDTVLLEAFVRGDDLRIIVINYEVVAAAIRKPAEVTGTGSHTIRELIEKQSRRRSAATGGESVIPLDDDTERCVHEAGYQLEDVLPYGSHLSVRKTANLHTGGTIHDVTKKLSPYLSKVAVWAAEALEVPVVGLDLMVPDVGGDTYWIIEANERPGLANHEPQPTAERFIDFLFPQTARTHSPKFGRREPR